MFPGIWKFLFERLKSKNSELIQRIHFLNLEISVSKLPRKYKLIKNILAPFIYIYWDLPFSHRVCPWIAAHICHRLDILEGIFDDVDQWSHTQTPRLSWLGHG